MQKSEYQKMYDHEHNYFWHVGRREMIDNQLKKHMSGRVAVKDILDVGCGTGINQLMLRKHGNVKGIDFSPEALDFCREREFTNVAEGDAQNLRESNDKYDLVVALDLLEHLDDDQKALGEFHRVLKPGGKVLVTVPAHIWLWSDHDEALHHRRRYTLGEVKKLFRKRGFVIEKCTYAFFSTFLPLAGARLASRLLKTTKSTESLYLMPPKWLNLLLTSLLRAEAKILTYINMPLGTSVICVAKKT